MVWTSVKNAGRNRLMHLVQLGEPVEVNPGESIRHGTEKRGVPVQRPICDTPF